MRGMRYCSTGVTVACLARPEWVVDSTRLRSSPTRLAAPPSRATGDDQHRHRLGARFSRICVTDLPSPTPKGAQAYIALPRRLYTSGIRSRIVQTAGTSRSGCERARGCLSITTILGAIDRMQTIRLRDRMERRILPEPQSRRTLDDILKRRVEMRFRHDRPPRIVRAFVPDRPGGDLERRSSGIDRTPCCRTTPLTRQEFVR